MIPMARIGRSSGFRQIPMARVGRALSRFGPVRLTRAGFSQIPMARVGKRANSDRDEKTNEDNVDFDYLDNLSRLWKRK